MAVVLVLIVLNAFGLCFVQSVTYVNQSGWLTEVPHADIPHNVTNLALSSTQISQVGDNEFSTYVELSTLNIARNAIDFVSETAFANTVVSNLKLHNNHLTYFPNLTAIASTLQILDIASNEITSIPAAYLAPLTKIKLLYLNFNPLSEWPDFTGFGSQASYTTLQMPRVTKPPLFMHSSVCYIESVRWEGGTPGMPSLQCPADATIEYFGLSTRQIDDSADFSGIETVATLLTLTLAKNALTAFPALPVNVRRSLTKLELQGNPIVTISPEVLTDYDSLQILYLDDTHIRGFPCELFNVTVTLFLTDMTSLSMDSRLWQQCFCDRDTLKMSKLSLNDLSVPDQLPDLSHSLCAGSSALELSLARVVSALYLSCAHV